MPQLKFELNGVSPGPRVVLKQVQQVWNQTLVDLKVRRVGKNDLAVAVSFEGPYSQMKVAASDGRYLGISLTHEAIPCRQLIPKRLSQLGS